MTADEMHEVFAEWNKGELDSYLIEITRDILGFKDEDGQPLVDKILDTAGQKGTGKWTGDRGARPGHPAHADRRGRLRALPVGDQGGARGRLQGAHGPDAEVRRATGRPSSRTSAQALYASKIVSYAQGYMLMRAAAKEYDWNLNYGGIALMWRGGCIIRSRLPRQDQGGLRQRTRASRTCCSTRSSATRSVSSQEAWRARRRGRGPERHPGAGVRHGPGLLRRLPRRAPAGEPAAGAARLLRRPHLRAHRQAARASSSTPTGPAAAARPRRRRTPRRW